MVKKKILITGGSGYIGSRLSLYLSQKGFDIIPLCNSKIPNNREWVQSMHLVLQGDLRDKATLNNIEAVRPDVIIHLVSLDHNQSGLNIEETLQVNVQSTWELLGLSASIGLEKFIYFSTTQVYGQISEKVVTENTKLRPVNAYGLTHKMSEDLVDFYKRSRNLDAVSLRLSNSYGEPVFNYSNGWSLVLNEICKSVFNTGRVVLSTDGTSKRDFIHYNSILHVVEQLIVKKNINQSCYNLCSGKSISILHLAVLVCKYYEKRYRKTAEIYINNTRKLDVKECNEINYICQYSNLRLVTEFEINDFNLNIGPIFKYLEEYNELKGN